MAYGAAISAMEKATDVAELCEDAVALVAGLAKLNALEPTTTIAGQGSDTPQTCTKRSPTSAAVLKRASTRHRPRTRGANSHVPLA
jgi:hypothetical protein